MKKKIIIGLCLIGNIFMLSCQTDNEEYNDISWKTWKDKQYNIDYYSLWDNENYFQNILIQYHNGYVNVFLRKDRYIKVDENNKESNKVQVLFNDELPPMQYYYKQVGKKKTCTKTTLEDYVCITESNEFVGKCKTATKIRIQKEIEDNTFYNYTFQVTNPLNINLK